MKQRIKHCAICKVDLSTMYRVQYKNPKEWLFVCKSVLKRLKRMILTIPMEVLGGDRRQNIIIVFNIY
jgi:hypothetical protein